MKVNGWMDGPEQYTNGSKTDGTRQIEIILVALVKLP